MYVFCKIFLYYKSTLHKMQRFAIVEFEDGLQLVPSTWMLDEKECFWPPYTNLSKMNRAISNCEAVSDNWQIHKIIRVFGTASK